MYFKSYYTSSILFISTLILFTGYFINLPTHQINGRQSKYLVEPLNLTGSYITQEHTVFTEDGYILKVFRIFKRNCQKIRPPVILMHGLLQSSDVWLDAGPNAGLAYLLVNSCFDLWIGNQRGNYHGRRHVTLNPDIDTKFWDFSVDEIGLYDVPATIDYVLDHSSSSKVNYIGYSQGSGVFFIMCSEKPGYCDKVNVLISLAPAARQTHTKSMIYRNVATNFNRLFNVFGNGEVFSIGSTGQRILASLCKFPLMTNSICGAFTSIFDSGHFGSITNDTMQVMYKHFPAGTSVKNMARYGQSMASSNFEKFDYGKEENLIRYGNVTPPFYNLKAVNIPVLILYGRNDHLVDPKDIKWLSKRLPKIREVIEVEDPLWNHFDVTYSQFCSDLLYPHIYKHLINYSY